jgi:hypothetical protein
MLRGCMSAKMLTVLLLLAGAVQQAVLAAFGL